MTDAVSGVVELDIVLLGSAFTYGVDELVWLGLVVIAWLAFGAWLWRRSPEGDAAQPLALYCLGIAGLATAVFAGDALLFYTGVALASYGTLGVLLSAHGPGHARIAALHMALLVAGDLLLFELVVYLYADAQTAEFAGLRSAFLALGEGAAVSFASVLLVSAGACRLAVVLLWIPLPGLRRAWRPGAVPGLLCTACLGGIMTVRLLASDSGAPGWQAVLLAMSLMALVLILVLCIGLLCLPFARRGFAGLGWGAALIMRRGESLRSAFVALSATAIPSIQSLEQRLLSWPVAVAGATLLGLLFVLRLSGLFS